MDVVVGVVLMELADCCAHGIDVAEKLGHHPAESECNFSWHAVDARDGMRGSRRDGRERVMMARSLRASDCLGKRRVSASISLWQSA
jgi:hypothetical protein